MDPGLQPQRTALAWTRTATSLALNAVLLLRAGWVSASVHLTVLAAVLLGTAGLAFAYGRRREQCLDGTSLGRASSLVLKLLAGAVFAGSLAAVVAILELRFVSVPHSAQRLERLPS
jgi:hypothetical protein